MWMCSITTSPTWSHQYKQMKLTPCHMKLLCVLYMCVYVCVWRYADTYLLHVSLQNFLKLFCLEEFSPQALTFWVTQIYWLSPFRINREFFNPVYFLFIYCFSNFTCLFVVCKMIKKKAIQTTALQGQDWCHHMSYCEVCFFNYVTEAQNTILQLFTQTQVPSLPLQKIHRHVNT